MQPKRYTFIIAREGWPILGVALAFWMLALWMEFLPWVFFVIVLFLGWVYRNPERITDEEDKLALLAPIDGKISSIEQCRIEASDEKLLCVHIEGQAFGIGVLRAPACFTCKGLRLRDGLNLAHDTAQAPLLNARLRLHCEARGGDFWIGVQAGPLMKHIITYNLKKPFRMGDRFGFGLGAKVSLYLPSSVRIRANVGDKVYGGESVLGYFKSEK